MNSEEVRCRASRDGVETDEFGAFLFADPVLNMVFMFIAVFTGKCAATMLWSRYCPSLSDTGLVSSATGYLDFMSYIAAAISSSLFANAVDSIGWSNLILVWFFLMVVGVLVMIPVKKTVHQVKTIFKKG